MNNHCLPPRVAYTASTFEIPNAACDTHTHVFGPYDQYPLAEGRTYTPTEATGDALVAHLDLLGFQRGVAVTGNASGTDNRSLLEALKTHPDRLRGIAVAAVDTSERDIDLWHQMGVRGLRVNMFRHAGKLLHPNGMTLETLESLAPILRTYGWHAQVWIHVPDLPEYAPRLRKLGLPLVVDHMGRMSTKQGLDEPGFQLLRAMVSEGSAWTKISGADRISDSGPPYIDVDPFAISLLHANIERIIWGSDWPHVKYFKQSEVPDDGELLNLLGRWIADASDRHRVLVDNPSHLYDFPVIKG